MPQVSTQEMVEYNNFLSWNLTARHACECSTFQEAAWKVSSVHRDAILLDVLWNFVMAGDGDGQQRLERRGAHLKTNPLTTIRLLVQLSVDV
jgi:hypothetical protein